MQTHSRRWGRRPRITADEFLCHALVVLALAVGILMLCALTWVVS